MGRSVQRQQPILHDHEQRQLAREARRLLKHRLHQLVALLVRASRKGQHDSRTRAGTRGRRNLRERGIVFVPLIDLILGWSLEEPTTLRKREGYERSSPGLEW